MRTEDEIKEKIIEVKSLKLPEYYPDRHNARKLNHLIVKALEWVLEDTDNVR